MTIIILFIYLIVVIFKKSNIITLASKNLYSCDAFQKYLILVFLNIE